MENMNRFFASRTLPVAASLLTAVMMATSAAASWLPSIPSIFGGNMMTREQELHTLTNGTILLIGVDLSESNPLPGRRAAYEGEVRSIIEQLPAGSVVLIGGFGSGYAADQAHLATNPLTGNDSESPDIKGLIPNSVAADRVVDEVDRLSHQCHQGRTHIVEFLNSANRSMDGLQVSVDGGRFRYTPIHTKVLLLSDGLEDSRDSRDGGVDLEHSRGHLPRPEKIPGCQGFEILGIKPPPSYAYGEWQDWSDAACGSGKYKGTDLSWHFVN